jgi:hypothetical protein
MESADAARARLLERQRALEAELLQVQQHLGQLNTTVAVSKWWRKPSGPEGRGTVFHTGTDPRCRPGNRPDEITLYEALQAGLVPCGRCRPRSA